MQLLYIYIVYIYIRKIEKLKSSLLLLVSRVYWSSGNWWIRLNDKRHSNETKLLKHIYVWGLKKQGQTICINWSILRQAAAYTRGAKQCNLCLEEKLCIMKADKRNILNKRSEFVSKYRHRNRCTISNTCRDYIYTNMGEY